MFGGDGVVGGAERYAFELARHMARDVPTRLLTFGAHDSSERLDDLNIRVVGNPWLVRGEQSNPLSLSIIAEVRKADVVHCHQQHILASSLAAMVCRLSGRRVFVSDLGGGGWDVSSYVKTDGWYHGHLHLSEYSLKLYGHEGQPFAHVILGGVDTEKFSPAADCARTASVLFVGRIMPHKGINYLVEAMPPDIELNLIGAPYHQRFLADLEQLAVGKRVVYRHDCDDRGLVEAYRQASCVVLPSVYRTMYGDETQVPELLGQTLLEAMACGVPVICTRVGSLPEIVEHGVVGFVVPPNDPVALRERILWIMEHPSHAAAMGREGRRRVLEKFTWPAVVRKCLRIYGDSDPSYRNR
ncbi:MAG TPA: glycosyltransferase family 4 protein [Candidatus Binataceae bacterium]|nr:glycosyltransferase family 4 protein [Candidatus Binataceae bacterium]